MIKRTSVRRPVRTAPRQGRNDPCRCGSGRKYKKCHLAVDERVEHEIVGDFDPLPQTSET